MFVKKQTNNVVVLLNLSYNAKGEASKNDTRKGAHTHLLSSSTSSLCENAFLAGARVGNEPSNSRMKETIQDGLSGSLPHSLRRTGPPKLATRNEAMLIHRGIESEPVSGAGFRQSTVGGSLLSLTS